MLIVFLTIQGLVLCYFWHVIRQEMVFLLYATAE